MKTHNTHHHDQGVANDVEWGETDKLNMSGWGDGSGGNVQETMADVHNGGITQDERTLVPTRESNTHGASNASRGGDAMTKIADGNSECMNQAAWWYVVRVLQCERHQQDSVVNCVEGYTVKTTVGRTRGGCV